MQEERYGTRDRAYSAWHRRNSTRRFVGLEQAQLLSLTDIDVMLFCEYDGPSREPLALVETARDVGQTEKVASVTKNLAKRAHIPAYVVLYQLSAKRNPADASQPDIERFRVKRLWPKPERKWRTLSPSEWADGLLRIRQWATRRLDAAANDPDYDLSPTGARLRGEELAHEKEAK